MAKSIQIFLIVFLAVILQTSLLPNFFPAGFVPNLLVIAVIFLSARIGFDKMWKWALISGLIYDFLFFLPVGISAAAFLAVSFAVSFLTKRLNIVHESWRFVVLAILIACGTIINSGLIFILAKIFIYREKIFALSSFSFWNMEIGKVVIMNLFLFLLVYAWLKKFERLIILR